MRENKFCIIANKMSTQTLEKTIKKLSNEVASLRSFVIDIVRNENDEGEFKPSFVKSVLKEAKNKATLEYSKRGSLLSQIREL